MGSGLRRWLLGKGWTIALVPGGAVAERADAVGLPDLLVAAVAERAHVTVLQNDAGYDLVA
jgi:predicted nucleic acid-binding protein